MMNFSFTVVDITIEILSKGAKYFDRIVWSSNTCAFNFYFKFLVHELRMSSNHFWNNFVIVKCTSLAVN